MSLLLICGGLILESVYFPVLLPAVHRSRMDSVTTKTPYTQKQMQMAKVSQSCHNGRAQRIWAEHQYLPLQMLCLELALFPAVFLADLQM